MSETTKVSATEIISRYCIIKRQVLPAYEFSRISSWQKVCSLKYFSEEVQGKGRTKKKAKRNAAENLIDHLCTKYDSISLNLLPEPHLVGDLTSERKITKKIEPKKAKPMKTIPNTRFIEKLLNHCFKNKLPEPVFEIIKDATSSRGHREIRIKCTVNDIEEVGIGSSKQQAKRMAAIMMLEVLRLSQIACTDGASPLETDEDSNFLKQLADYCEKNELPIPSFEIDTEDTTNSNFEFKVKCTVNDIDIVASSSDIEQVVQMVTKKVLDALRLEQSIRENGSQLDEPPKQRLTTKKGRKRKRAVNVVLQGNFSEQLSEYCVKNQLPQPSFEIVPTLNLRGRTEFSVKCTVSEVEKLGTESNEEKAKQAAAKMVLETLLQGETTRKNDSQSDEVNERLRNSKEPDGSSEQPLCDEVTSGEETEETTNRLPDSNYVDQLLAYCKQKKTQPPLFEVVEYATNSYDFIEFRVKCSTNIVELVATGPNIEGAKQAAAMKMLEKLRIKKRSIRTRERRKNQSVNYTGKLLEYCVMNNLPEPSFKISSCEMDSPRRRRTKFSVQCTVKDIEKVVIARRIKIAKRAAAKLVLKEIGLRESVQDGDGQVDKNGTNQICEDVLPVSNTDNKV